MRMQIWLRFKYIYIYNKEPNTQIYNKQTNKHEQKSQLSTISSWVDGWYRYSIIIFNILLEQHLEKIDHNCLSVQKIIVPF